VSAVNDIDSVFFLLPGLRKLGVIVTLLNIHSREEALLNSIKITDNKVLIVGQGK